MTDDRDLLKKLLEEIRKEQAEKEKTGDPNVNLFLGVLNDDIGAVRDALDADANVNITDSAVIEYHRPLLKKRCRDLLERWDAQREIGPRAQRETGPRAH